MIKNLTGGGKHIVAASSSGSTQYINLSMNNPASGQLRFLGQYLEVYDGNAWTQLQGGYATVGLTGTAENAIDWAIQRMTEEAKFKLLGEKHPGVKDAIEQLTVAMERVRIMIALTEEEQK